MNVVDEREVTAPPESHYQKYHTSIRLAQKKYYDNNQEKIRKNMRDYYHNNPSYREKKISQMRAYRERKKKERVRV